MKRQSGYLHITFGPVLGEKQLVRFNCIEITAVNSFCKEFFFLYVGKIGC